MTTEAERLADHFEHLGKLLEVTALLRAQAAELERLKTEGSYAISLAEDERTAKDKANTLLRQALEALEKVRGDVNWMLNERKFLNGFVFDYLDEAADSIKTHLGEQT